MKRINHILAILLAALATSLALAQATLPPTEGEVRKVDKEAGKVTLKHGEIKNLDMPGMTMVFQVKDRALLDKVEAGDPVSFTADKVNGAYTVLTIEPRK
ncbi:MULTISPECIES: copper-binding protein [unclassified Polaromonas]|uniref:copper-binding protein n=1 Tax=unclassified Polaromonas TaxID=2638319 RepID=UPI000F08D041|nr:MULTISPECIES: copper-binding protein [unclassified Polaromonas]AYQ28834.1 RND transporter [Polaromonas sp. SP1]QGJ20049.1 RND transporter [Polaromonas sp. Pch-P]